MLPEVEKTSGVKARSTVGGTHGHLDLERDPLMHI